MNDLWLIARRLRAAVFGAVTYPPGGRFFRQRQRHLQLFILQDGKVQVTIDAEVFELEAPALFFMVPGSRYHFQFDPARPTAHSWIDFEGGEDDDWARFELLPVPIDTDAAMLLIIEQLPLREGAEPEFGGIRVEALGMALLSLTCAYHHTEHESVSTHPAVAKAKHYIAHHFAEELSLSAVADAASVAPATLARLFARDCGFTVMKHVWTTRVEHAQVLMENTGLPLSIVAERSGFKSPHHFSRKFVELVGSTPRAWRAAR